MNVVRIIRWGFAIAFVAVMLVAGGQNAAIAQSCTTTGYTYDASCSGNANTSGTTVTSAALVTTAAATTVGLVTSRLSQFRQGAGSSVRGALPSKQLFAAGNGTGASAGENMDTRMGVWGNLSYLRTEGDKTGAGFDSDLTSGMVGMDYRVGSIDNPTFVGVGLGYETADITTTFNRGGVDSTGMTIAPYVSFGLSNVFSFDVVGGYSKMSYDTNRKDPLSSSLITGSFDADRYFGSADLVGSWQQQKWNLGARVGTSYVSESQDAYRESNGTSTAGNDITVGSANLGARVGYDLDKVQPYVGATYSYDYDGAGGTYDGRDTVGGSLGMNIAVAPNLSVNVEGRTSAKEDITNYGGSATVRLNF